MPYTLADLENVRRKRLAGANLVREGDKQTGYDLAQLAQLEAEIRAELLEAAGAPRLGLNVRRMLRYRSGLASQP